MKKYFRLLLSFGLVLSLILSLSITSFASLKDLMIVTDSNALMTLELDDLDYSVMPMSSLGTVVNTISPSGIDVVITSYDTNGQAINDRVRANKVSGRYVFNYSLRDDSVISSVELVLNSGLPSAGAYDMSFDFASDFAMTYRDHKIGLWYNQNFTNASSVTGWLFPGCETYSGDVYMPSYSLDFGNVNAFSIVLFPTLSDSVRHVGGSFAVRFVKSTSGNGEVVGFDNTSADYQSDVSSSLSDLSSSVGEMSDEISGVTEAIQNLQGAMEPHYNNVLTQLHHITEQLHAFWDQQFNLHHVPLMAKLADIIEAIGNMDLEVEVNLNSLKTSIDTMSQAVQNKLQSTTDHITGGYDNSGMESDQQKLDDALNQYESAENEVLGGAKEHISDFEFDDSLEQFSSPLSDISYFLGAMFTGLGVMNVIISFSLTLTIAMCMIGWYRFKGGK